MPLLRWFWSLRLRWRIPLGGAVLLVAVSALYLLVAWLHYRQCRHLDLLSLVPGRMPLVLRCRDAGGHWDRIRQTDLYRVLEAQVRRHGPLVAWAESASGRTWDELTAPLASGPAAALLTEARLRGLLGTDVIVALEPPAAGPALPGAAPLPRALLLTRIGFTEYLAWPLARRLARRSTEGAEADVAARGVGGHSVAGVGGDSVADVPRPSPAERAPTRVGGDSVADVPRAVGLEPQSIAHGVGSHTRVGGDSVADSPPACERYRGIDVWRVPLPPGRFPPGSALGVAVKGDLLLVATDPDLLPDVLDRTFRDWAPSDDLPPWSLPEGVPLAAGADLHRIPPASGWREALSRVPVREALLPLDPDTLGRVTLALDVGADGLHLEAAADAPRPSPTESAPTRVGGHSVADSLQMDAVLAGAPDDAVAVAFHDVPFPDFLSFFEKVSLDIARETLAADALGGPWSFFRTQARDVELPALRRNGLETHLLPRLRGGVAVVLTREAGPVAGGAADAGAGAPPPQTAVVLVGTAGGGDAAETALHELLQRRVAPILAQSPRDVVVTERPVDGETVRLLQRMSWPVQVAYGEARGVLAVGVRPEAVVRAHEALLGRRKGLSSAPRFQAVLRALGGVWEATPWPTSKGPSPTARPAGAPEVRRRESAPTPLSLLYVDLRRLGAMLREVSQDLARFAKDRIDGPRLRQTIKGRSPRQPQETVEAWERRITGLFEAEVKRTVDEARARIESPALFLDPFSAAGLSITPVQDGYLLRAVLLQP